MEHLAFAPSWEGNVASSCTTSRLPAPLPKTNCCSRSHTRSLEGLTASMLLPSKLLQALLSGFMQQTFDGKACHSMVR